MSADEPRPRKVHKVTLLIVDHDEVGEAEIRTVIENARYPNHCIGPSVMAIETREVQWTDAHPLNDDRYAELAFEDLFGDTGEHREP